MPKPFIFNLLLAAWGLVPAPISWATPWTGGENQPAWIAVESATEEGCPGSAGPEQPATEPVIFGDLDKNRNNYWDKEEVHRYQSITSIWEELDINGNGRVSRNEFNDYLRDVGPVLLSKQQIRALVMPEGMGGCAS